ncbi:MAG: hypothetical protein Q7T59_01785, partial [Candidatus Woesebacteria bacterium]|nr:hypothetical protein [Candidatus Woesebacteria bacterium]
MKKNKIIKLFLNIKFLIFLIVISVLANITLLLKLDVFKNFNLSINKENLPIITSKETNNELFEAINPTKGFEINVSFNDLGPKMIASGIIDKDKFTNVYERSNQPLTPNQLQILTKGSSEKIKIDRNNSYFLLNFFWAVGLNNKSKILDEGDMMKYGGIKGAANFASTGGWSLAKGDTMNYYSKNKLINLTPEQEKLVEEVSASIFRPCCNNSTAFPDCNHGMALLGVLELMAGNGATKEEMYEAGKYF